MARKIHPDESRPDDGRDDISVIHPDRLIPVLDPDTKTERRITVHEYGFEESLELRPLTNLIVDALYKAFQMRSNLTGEEVLDLLATQPKVVKVLVARAIREDESWVQRLAPIDAETVTLAWWVVNRGFFVMRATRRLRPDQATATDGPTSTPPSSPTDTADPSKSDATHAGS